LTICRELEDILISRSKKEYHQEISLSSENSSIENKKKGGIRLSKKF
jgi:hypothetical protein